MVYKRGFKGTTRRLMVKHMGPVLKGETGIHYLELDRHRDGLIYVPEWYDHQTGAPLVLLLHGAGGNARHAMDLFYPYADEMGIILLAPDSRESSWDMSIDDHEDDAAFIDRALLHTFQYYAIDPQCIAIGGFSDGASYALSLGQCNDLFTDIIAFSPGFSAPACRKGAPRIFISHGIQDNILPIERCGRLISHTLVDIGYDVTYIEFDGPHAVPRNIAEKAVRWLLHKEHL